MYEMTRKLSGKGPRSIPPLRAADDRVLWSKEEQLLRWTGYFTTPGTLTVNQASTICSETRLSQDLHAPIAAPELDEIASATGSNN